MSKANDNETKGTTGDSRSFRDSVERIEDMKDSPDMICVWRNSTGWIIHRDDLEGFYEHMDVWYTVLLMNSLTRKEYEGLCTEYKIDSVPDEAIGGYGDKFGDYGMEHYHTIPENRRSGLLGTFNQLRWYGILKENPNIEEERALKEWQNNEARRLEILRKTYPVDLDVWIESVGGIEVIYAKMVSLHSNNNTQLDDRHFEWLIGHACMRVGYEASKGHPDYREFKSIDDKGVNPLVPEWWADWGEYDEEHPINRIAFMLSDRRGNLEPYKGKVTYIGYGEDCGDDVRRNLQEWL